MHARMARWAFIGDPHELARQAQEGMLPLFQSQPGFVSYSIMAADGEILSFSIWDTAEQADAANTVSREWVTGNFPSGQLELKETRVGEILVATALGVTAGASS
jgi:hypothetical protein